MDRRRFLQSSGLAFGAAVALPSVTGCATDTPAKPAAGAYDGSWESVRGLFPLDHRRIQMSQMLLASHPAPVRAEIDRHRAAFDASPMEYWEEHFMTVDAVQQQAAARYLGCDPEEVGLTDSTTQGLGLLYGGLKLAPGDEIVTTTHDHYATEMSLAYAAAKTGATIKRVAEYADPAATSVDEVVGKLTAAIGDRTRVVAVTWVHSCSGVKLPIAAIGKAVAEINRKRDADARIYYCVDGVHGFGVENLQIREIGCDFLVAGTHKWLFGPRGTGIVFGRKSAWDMYAPTIPAFRNDPYFQWLGAMPAGPIDFGQLFSPGGFHAFEHRWSQHVAFDLHMEIGKKKIEARTHELATRLKAGLAEIPAYARRRRRTRHCRPASTGFVVDGMSAEAVVTALHEKGVIASASPYADSIPRLTPCVINTEDEVDRSLKALAEVVA